MDSFNLELELEKAGICDRKSMQGCNISEISEIERRLSDKLPQAYIAFLLLVGRAAGVFFSGTDIFYSQIGNLNEDASLLLVENGFDIDVLENSFVFLMHQGYEFCLFYLHDGEDPPVYQFVEGRGGLECTWESFTSFLRDAVDGQARIRDVTV